MIIRFAASYARKSNANELGIEEQHRLNAAEAEERGFKIPDDPAYRFSDDATSGARTKRPGLDRLEAAARSDPKLFEIIFVKDRSRLGRFERPQHTAYLEELFERIGTPLVFVHSLASGISSEGASGQFMHTLAAAFESAKATSERSEIVTRTRSGIRNRVLIGRFPGPVAPYATERWLFNEATNQFVERVRPGHAVRRARHTYMLKWGPQDQLSVVERIYKEFLGGASLNSIAASLNKNHIASPESLTSRHERWNGKHIRRILRNPIYKGDLIWGRTRSTLEPRQGKAARADGKEPILMPGFLDCLIPNDQWSSAQDLLKRMNSEARARRGPPGHFPLSSLLRCAECGAPYNGYTSSHKGRSVRHRYYRHDHRPRSGVERCCWSSRYFRADPLEAEVWDGVLSLCADPHLKTSIRRAFTETRKAETGKKNERRCAAIRAQLSELDGEDERIAEAMIKDPSADLAQSLSRALERRRARREKLLARLAELESLNSAWIFAGGLVDELDDVELTRSGFLEATESERRQILNDCIRVIRVDPGVDRAEVEFCSFAPLVAPTTPEAVPSSTP